MKLIIFKIILNKIVNYFKFKYDILSNVFEKSTRVKLLTTGETGTIIHYVIGTKHIAYSVKFDNEQYGRRVDHNYLEVLK
jgi:hypothetical protein